LFEGTEGEFRTVDQMKAAFDAAYADLVTAVGGVATDFEFFANVPAINGGVTTVQEGSGAIFEIQDLGDGTYNGSDLISGGVNYLPGHKIKISGEDLGATSGVASSIIVTNGPNLNWTNAGIVAGNTGLEFSITVDENGNATVSNISNGGTGKSVGDTFTLLGTAFTGLSSPEDDISFEITAIDVSANDCIITVNSVDSEGISGWSVEGVAAGVGGASEITFTGESSVTFSASTNKFNFGSPRTRSLSSVWSSFAAGATVSFVISGTTYTSTLADPPVSGGGDPMLPAPYTLNLAGSGGAPDGSVTEFTIGTTSALSEIAGGSGLTVDSMSPGGPFLSIGKPVSNATLAAAIPGFPIGATIKAWDSMGSLSEFTLTSAFTDVGDNWKATFTQTSGSGTSFNSATFSSPAGGGIVTYGPVTGTNYEVGSGFTVGQIVATTGYVEYSTYGTNYVVGDVITLPGANLATGATPANNITITVTAVDGAGQAYQYTSTGTVPRVWRTNSISDGGEDEYDTGNYIDSSLANQIAYNSGNTVTDGVAAFGTGSSYSFVYEDSIFGLFVTGNNSTSIGTSGSGPDSGSTIISGHIYGPNTAEQTFDNAVSFINLVGTPYAGPLITFTRTDYGDEIDEISEGLHITKDDQGWLYNALEDDVEGDNTPTGSLWNNDGWDDFTNVESRTYTSLSDIWYGNFASIPGAKMIMLDETTGKYWAIEFLSWTNNNQGGGASYTRQELDLDSLEVGIRFSDGTRQTTAYVPTNVKLTAPGSRRIEEVAGYKQVSVTGTTTGNTVTTTAFSNNSNDTRYLSLSASGAARDALIALSNGSVYYRVQVSLNQTDWATGSVNGWGNDDVGIYLDDGARLAVAQGDTVYYRIRTGGEPVVWWDEDDLPGGRGNFRGAVIDYHAYTGDATIIGTIHIADDNGNEHITHTEASSGNSDSENDDLWYVTSEGEIRYRRLDGESNTLKIQWTAKVFYGSETND
jgi:hypothetical protein